MSSLPLEMDSLNENGVANRKERGVRNRLVLRNPPSVRSRWYDDPNCVRLAIMLGLTTSYFVVELVWGLAVGSLALVADAMHMFSDIIGMGIGLYSLRVGKRPPSLSATYGWIRMEVIGGLTNAAFLMGISFIIVLDSIARFFESNNETLQNSGTNVLIVGGVGLVINLIGLFVLSSGHGHSHGGGEAENPESHSHSNINVHGVLLHVAGDALGSVAVIVSGIAIRFSDSDRRVLADPICSLFISLLICLSAVPLMKRCISVLLQQAPLHINMSALEVELRRVPTVMDLHELHVWQLTPERIVGSVHLLFHEHISSEAIASIKVAFHAHGVHATTIQTEVLTGQVAGKAMQETFLCEEPVCEEDCTTKSCCVHAA